MSGPVDNDIENRLRKALSPVDPGGDLTQRVLARIAAEQGGGRAPPAVALFQRAFLRRQYPWLPAAMAASLAVVVVGMYQWQERREQAEGLEARQQLIDALRVTSEKLDLAYQVVKTQTQTQTQRESDEDAAHES